ncbi:hypothetical protein GGX14DRAFT_387865 [Mycena pura]|uniref:Uncharacterized protein n=1 Tax=Mycena pura TaxID=153505 RepID=A0AAD7E2H8_9AGAR|nr:hypothetical protein GGX14DRAFT_387865 [Mycena pura]
MSGSPSSVTYAGPCTCVIVAVTPAWCITCTGGQVFEEGGKGDSAGARRGTAGAAAIGPLVEGHEAAQGGEGAEPLPVAPEPNIGIWYSGIPVFRNPTLFARKSLWRIGLVVDENLGF